MKEKLQKTKGKVVAINSEKLEAPAVTGLVFPPGDPRNDMTLEEIEAFARKEEAEVNRRLAIMAKAAPPPCEVTEEDEEDDVEEFEVDLAKGYAKQTLASGVIIKPDNITTGDIITGSGSIQYSEPVAAPPVVDAYADIIKDSLVRFAINIVREELNTAHDTLDKMCRESKRLPYDVSESIGKEMDKLWNKKMQLTRIAFDGSGVVKYKDIPEWAEGQVKRYVRNSMDQLLSLVNKEDL